MNLEEVDKWLKDQYGISYTEMSNEFNSASELLSKKNKENERLKEEYMILQNASDEVEEEKDKEIERLNKETEQLRTALNSKKNIINDLEKYLEEIKDRVIMYAIDDDTYKKTNLYIDIKNKLHELKGDSSNE